MVFYGVIVDSQTKTAAQDNAEYAAVRRKRRIRIHANHIGRRNAVSSSVVASPLFSAPVFFCACFFSCFFSVCFFCSRFFSCFFSPLVSSPPVSSPPVPSPVCFFSACFRPVCAAVYISSSKLSSLPVRLLYKNGRAISVMLEAPFINEPMGLCTALRILSAFSHTPLNTLYSTVSGV